MFMTTLQSRLKASLLATALAATVLSANAAGLGGITVLSGLGQPLRAEIALQATDEELRTLRARLAPPEAFAQANVAYAPVMNALEFAIDTRGARSVVTITSQRPIDDPFVELLLELSWAQGRVLRQFTFLLDPPASLRPPLAVATAIPAATPADTDMPARISPAIAQHQVRAGDTLYSIAAKNLPAGFTIDQMMMALLRHNPAAFADANVNRLLSGAMLRMPDSALIASMSAADARREIVAQAQAFEAFRRRLAGAPTSLPLASVAEPGREQSGQIISRSEVPDAVDPAQDRVEVSAGEPLAAETGATERIQALEEELVSRERALDEAHARLGDLERGLRELQALIEVRHQTLAQLQQRMASEPVAMPTEDAAHADALPQAPEATQGGESSGYVAVPDAPPPVAVNTLPVRTEPGVVEPTLLQMLLRDPVWLAGAGAILLLLLAYASYRVRRVVDTDPGPQGPDTEQALEATVVAASPAAPTVVLAHDAPTVASQAVQSGLDTLERVDPLAEAEVYLTYGRDDEAEAVLIEALKADGTRAALALALLEIYARKRRIEAFGAVAHDLYQLTRGQGPDWDTAAQLGRGLDPDNPLYAPARPAEPPVSARAPSSDAHPAAAAGSGATPVGLTAGGAMITAAAPARQPAVDDREAEIAAHTPPSAGQQSDLGDLTKTWSMAANPARPQAHPQVASAGDGGVQTDRDAQHGLGGAFETARQDDFAALDFDLKGSVPAAGTPKADATPAAFDFDLDLAAAPAEGHVEHHASSGPGIRAASSRGAEGGTPTHADAPRSTRQGVTEDVSAADDRDAASRFDDELLDFDFGLAPAARPPVRDWLDIDLELDGGQDPLPDDAVAQALPNLSATHTHAETQRAQVMDTRLDLAQAYQDMGDQNAARELLDEVLKDGSPEQQAAARRLRQELD